MGIITKKVEVKLWGTNIKYYKSLGYNGRQGDVVIVNVEDLSDGCNVRVIVACDYCGKECNPRYVEYRNSVKIDGTYACSHCGIRKAEKAVYQKYGVLNYSSTKECREKVANTMMSRYGVNHVSKSNEFLKRKCDNNKEKYGVEHTLQVKEFRDKGIQTNLQKYGVEYPSFSDEIIKKRQRTFYKNGTIPTSNQQLYIFNLYKSANSITELNFPISHYSADICFPEEKLTVEIDFGGHDLQVKTGKLTQEEFNQKEIIRNNIIKREGYKQMRIVSRKDRLPQDSILLQMLSESKQYFQTTQHSWQVYDIDKSLLFNAEHKDGIPYDFGSLRTIKDSDLANLNSSQITI